YLDTTKSLARLDPNTPTPAHDMAIVGVMRNIPKSISMGRIIPSINRRK
ncbi:18568_t:CDS:1, partial [Racocetra persica]